nr:MAG TPA: hypothetical protein [Bacteriophage sp.]
MRYYLVQQEHCSHRLYISVCGFHQFSTLIISSL